MVSWIVCVEKIGLVQGVYMCILVDRARSRRVVYCLIHSVEVSM